MESQNPCREYKINDEQEAFSYDNLGFTDTGQSYQEISEMIRKAKKEDAAAAAMDRAERFSKVQAEMLDI